jgi:hypothetical protein
MLILPLSPVCLCCVMNLSLPFTITVSVFAILGQVARSDMLEPLELGLWPTPQATLSLTITV